MKNIVQMQYARGFINHDKMNGNNYHVVDKNAI
jgi:hypothetical protein